MFLTHEHALSVIISEDLSVEEPDEFGFMLTIWKEEKAVPYDDQCEDKVKT